MPYSSRTAMVRVGGGGGAIAIVERRAHVRAPVSLTGAVMSPDGEAPVLVVDLSPRGARLQVGSPPDPASEYQLYFSVHRTSYDPKFRVVHWAGGEGGYNWGCTFYEIPTDQSESLRRTVHAAMGMAKMSIRAWAEVSAEAASAPAAEVVVGCTPSGRDIHLPGQDCLDIGPDGLELFVRTVAELETV